MIPPPLDQIYLDLWHIVDEAKPHCPVVYAPQPQRTSSAEGGVFLAEQKAIWIFRGAVPHGSDRPDLAGATLEELITLAHERGHEQSHRDGEYKASSLNEEHRAWRHAETLLRAKGFDRWDEFRAQKAESLRIHEDIGIGR